MGSIVYHKYIVRSSPKMSIGLDWMRTVESCDDASQNYEFGETEG